MILNKWTLETEPSHMNHQYFSFNNVINTKPVFYQQLTIKNIYDHMKRKICEIDGTDIYVFHDFDGEFCALCVVEKSLYTWEISDVISLTSSPINETIVKQLELSRMKLVHDFHSLYVFK